MRLDVVSDSVPCIKYTCSCKCCMSLRYSCQPLTTNTTLIHPLHTLVDLCKYHANVCVWLIFRTVLSFCLHQHIGIYKYIYISMCNHPSLVSYFCIILSCVLYFCTAISYVRLDIFYVHIYIYIYMREHIDICAYFIKVTYMWTCYLAHSRKRPSYIPVANRPTTSQLPIILITGRDRLRLTAFTTNHHGDGAKQEFWKTIVYTSDAHVRWNSCDRWSSSYHAGIYFDSDKLS